jgi:hypothetical protein
MTLSPLALRLRGCERRQYIHDTLRQDFGTAVEARKIGFSRGASLVAGTAIGSFLWEFSL